MPALFRRGRSTCLPPAPAMLLVILCLVAPVLQSADSTNWKFPQADRIVAFADVHGAYDELRALLRQAGVIDERDNWSGGSTRLVSTGDLVDRGADSRKVIELLMRLQNEAPEKGGSVHVVLGNHELMLVTGDLRYVSAGEFAAFAGDESKADRDAAFDRYRSLRPNQDPVLLHQAFNEKIPPGFLALNQSFSTRGEIGRWLLAQPMVLQIGDTVFLHGGLSNALVGLSLEEVNSSLKKDLLEYLGHVEFLSEAGVLRPTIAFLERPDYLERVLAAHREAKGKRYKPAWARRAARLMELQDSMLFTEMSPLWYRGNSTCNPYTEAFDVERVLANWKATRVMVGHTPTPTRRIRSRLEGQVIQADTGMLASVYRGRPSALVIEDGKPSVIYAGEDGVHAPEADQLRFAHQPRDLDDAAMESFLATAEVTANAEIDPADTGSRRLTLEHGGRSLDALFKSYDSHAGLESVAAWKSAQHEKSNRYVYEIAAYRLDRMLDLYVVPVAVARVVDGVPGMVQMWVDNTISERDRVEQEVRFSGYCPQFTQYRLRSIFDVLIHNENRELTDILWHRDDFRMILIDHSLSFRGSTKRPRQYRKLPLELPELLRSRLEALDLAALDADLGPYLHSRQIEAILQRRDKILEQAERTGFAAN